MGAAPNLTLWVDFETTGLRLPGASKQPDSLMEVAAILTGPDLVPITRYRSVVHPEPTSYSRMMGDDFLVDMHTKSGLLDELRAKKVGQTLIAPAIVDGQMVDWLERAGVGPNEAMLAGSGIGHFDYTMAATWLPRLMAHLHYRIVDVSSVREAFRLAGGLDLSAPNSAKTHRAMDDVECHLEEARAYFDAIRRIADATPAAVA